MNRPKWFDYIRVRERHYLGTNKPVEYLVSFGRQNICVPATTPERAEALAESIKEWLLVMMENDRNPSG